MTTWSTPRHPHTNRPFPIDAILADPPFLKGVRVCPVATTSSSSVTTSSLVPACFAVSSYTVASGGIYFCSHLAHGRSSQRSLLYSIPAHGRSWQRPTFSQPSHASLRSLLAHDRLWQVSPFTAFSRTPSQPHTRSLVAASASSQSSRAPLCRLLTQDCLWQASPFHSPLAHPLAVLSHTIARGSLRLSAVFSSTPS